MPDPAPIDAASWNAALALAAEAVQRHDKQGREWVRGSLWDALSIEASGRVRALMLPEDA